MADGRKTALNLREIRQLTTRLGDGKSAIPQTCDAMKRMAFSRYFMDADETAYLDMKNDERRELLLFFRDAKKAFADEEAIAERKMGRIGGKSDTGELASISLYLAGLGVFAAALLSGTRLGAGTAAGAVLAWLGRRKEKKYRAEMAKALKIGDEIAAAKEILQRLELFFKKGWMEHAEGKGTEQY